MPANHCRTATTCAFGLPGDGATLALPLPLHNGVAHGFGWPGDTAACAFHVCFLGAVGFPAQTHANMMGTHADPPTQKKLICSGRAGYACIHIYVYRYLYSYQTLLRVIRAWRGSGAPARIHKGIHRSIHRSIHRNINRSWSRGVGQARLAPLNLQYIYISIYMYIYNPARTSSTKLQVLHTMRCCVVVMPHLFWERARGLGGN